MRKKFQRSTESIGSVVKQFVQARRVRRALGDPLATTLLFRSAEQQERPFGPGDEHVRIEIPAD